MKQLCSKTALVHVGWRAAAVNAHHEGNNTSLNYGKQRDDWRRQMNNEAEGGYKKAKRL